MIKYKTGGWSTKEIEEMEITGETSKYWKTKTGRELKKCKGHTFHDTHEQAKQHLIEKEEKHLQKLKGWIIQANTRLEFLKTLTPENQES